MTKTVNVKNKGIRKLFNLYLRGKKDKEFDNVLSKTTDGVLMPEELKHDLEAAKQYHNSVRQFVDVITVKELEGTYVTDDPSNVFQELVDFGEGKQITEQDLKVKAVAYELKRYGSFIKVSEELYQDADFDIVKFFFNEHAVKAVKTENKLVFNAIISNIPVKHLDSGQALKTSLFKDLNPALQREIKVITNQDGLEKLANEGLVENVIQPDGTLRRYLDIYPLEVYSNDELAGNGNGIPVIYGALSREVKLFTRDRLEVKVNMQTGFVRELILIRGIEDYDVKVLPNPTQVIYGEIPLA